MKSPESRLRDARWRARVWSDVEGFQRDHDRQLRLVRGAARTRTGRRARLRVVGTQPVKR